MGKVVFRARKSSGIKMGSNESHDSVSIEVTLAMKNSFGRQLTKVDFTAITGIKMPINRGKEALLNELSREVHQALAMWAIKKQTGRLVDIVRAANDKEGIPGSDNGFDSDDLKLCIDRGYIDLNSNNTYHTTSRGFDWMVMGAGTLL